MTRPQSTPKVCVTCRGFFRFRAHLQQDATEVVGSDQDRANARWFVSALTVVRPCAGHADTLRLAAALSAGLERGVTAKEAACISS